MASSTSRSYKNVKRFYEKGIYDKDDVAQFVEAGLITPAEYKTITGDDYVGEN